MEGLERNENINREKANLIFKAVITTLLTLMISGDVSLLFSMWDFERNLYSFLTITFSIGIAIALLIVVKKKIKEFVILSRLYFLALIVVLAILITLTYDRGIFSVMLYFAPLILIIYINVIRKYSIILFLIYIILNTFFMILMPVVKIQNGLGIYIVNYSIILSSFYICLLGINMFKRFEKMLFKELENAEELNKKTMELYEEVATSEEELRIQYEKISDLNLFNNKIIESFTRVNDTLEEGIIDFGISFDRVYASSQIEKLLHTKIGSSTEEFLNLISSCIDREKFSEFEKIWKKLYDFSNESYCIETEYEIDDSKYVLRINLLSYLSYEDESKHIIVVIRDITKEFYNSKRIFKIAFEDSLTGLLNRTSFLELIEKENESKVNKDLYIYILDVDDFKYYNNTFGFLFGDVLLKKIANRFKEIKNDKILAIARLNGDEFAFLTNEYIKGDIFLNMIQNSLQNLIIEDIDIKVYCSVGIASSLNKKESSEMILEKAEVAMYKAKEKGKRSSVEYLSSLQDEIKRKLEIINAIDKALDKDEFSLRFQPHIDSLADKIIGFEALIRWNSSALGWVSPYDFINLAEQTGYIHSIGEFVIRKACEFAKKIEDKNLIVSINVSGVQLLNDGFFDLFIGIANEIGVDPKGLAIEITETSIIDNKEIACMQLERFRESGVKVYLDDFGTGYSSLNYLTQLPIDVIKIDKTFIDKLMDRKQEYGVVTMIISLAEKLGLKTIAEGAEELSQINLLKEIGCNIIQGYYYSKPVFQDEAIKMLTGDNE